MLQVETSPFPLAQALTLVAVAVSLAAVTVAAVLARLRRRDQARIDALLGRLAELEGRLAGATTGEEVAAEDGGLEPLLEAAVAAAPAEAPSADVLAGRSSYVRRAVAGVGDAAETLAGQAIAAVHRHLAESLAPADLADELHCSLRTLERGLATALSCTPTQLIVAMKMREARRLLLSGRFRVNEVASRLGFSSPYHFSRRFKEFYRVAPSELIPRERAA